MERLSDDCIYLIVKELSSLEPTGWGEPKPIKPLSLVNKRFRQLCISFLFNSVKIKHRGYENKVGQFLKDLRNAPFVTNKLM